MAYVDENRDQAKRVKADRQTDGVGKQELNGTQEGPQHANNCQDFLEHTNNQTHAHAAAAGLHLHALPARQKHRLHACLSQGTEQTRRGHQQLYDTCLRSTKT